MSCIIQRLIPPFRLLSALIHGSSIATKRFMARTWKTFGRTDGSKEIRVICVAFSSLSVLAQECAWEGTLAGWKCPSSFRHFSTTTTSNWRIAMLYGQKPATGSSCSKAFMLGSASELCERIRRHDSMEIKPVTSLSLVPEARVNTTTMHHILCGTCDHP